MDQPFYTSWFNLFWVFGNISLRKRSTDSGASPRYNRPEPSEQNRANDAADDDVVVLSD